MAPIAPGCQWQCRFNSLEHRDLEPRGAPGEHVQNDSWCGELRQPDISPHNYEGAITSSLVTAGTDFVGES